MFWLQRLRKPIVVAIAVAAVGTQFPPQVLARAAGVSLTRPVRVSAPVSVQPSCSAADGNGPHIAVDPSNAKHLSVVYSIGEGYSGVVATSYDGGNVWTRTPLNGMTSCTGGPDGHVFDPMIATGAGGRVETSASWLRWTPDAGVDNLVNPTVALLTAHSDNGGAAFSAPVEPDPASCTGTSGTTVCTGGVDQRGPISFDPGSNDHLLLAFQRQHYLNPPSPFDSDSTWLIGLGSSIGVVRSADGGATWGQPGTAVWAATGQEFATIGLLRSGSSVVLVGVEVDDTSLAAAVAAKAEAFITGKPDTFLIPEHAFVARSDDDGATWFPPDYVPCGTYMLPVGYSGFSIPDATVGPDGAVYVVWPGASAGSVDVAKSADQGRSWTTTTSILSGGTITEPAIAVSSSGALAVFFYDMSADANGTDLDATPQLAVSTDAGGTWARATLAARFDASAIVASACPDVCDGTPMGPYQDVAAVPGGFGVTFTTGGACTAGVCSEDVWWVRASV